MDLSIIILNYNAAAFLEICLHSVHKATQHLDAQIVVVDNQSTDHSLQMVQQLYPQVTLVANQQNLGFSQGNNIGVNHAIGDYICILNPDTIVGDQVFDDLLAFAKANPQVALVTTQLIDGAGYYLPESKRCIPTPKVACKKLLGSDQSYYANHIPKDRNANVQILSGAMMLCRKSTYLKIGGFDKRYFMYGEDIDLSYTALLHGYSNYYMGTLKIIHFKGESTIKDKKYLQRFYGAMELFYNKHFKKNQLQQYFIKLAVKTIIAFKPIKAVTISRSNVINQVLVTNDSQLHTNRFEHIYSVYQLQNQDLPAHTQIVWDVTSLNYQYIIDYMSTHVGNNYTYRFLNPHRDGIIGSDSSNTRGHINKIKL